MATVFSIAAIKPAMALKPADVVLFNTHFEEDSCKREALMGNPAAILKKQQTPAVLKIFLFLFVFMQCTCSDGRSIQCVQARSVAFRWFDYDEISFELKNVEKIPGPDGQSQLKIDLSINAAGIDTGTLGGKRAFGVQAAIFYSDKKGNILGANFWKIEGSAGDEEYDRLMETGMAFSARIPLKDKDQIFKIVIYDEKSGRIGSKLAKKSGKGFALDPHPFPTPGPHSPAAWPCVNNRYQSVH